MSGYSINQICKLLSISKETLRYYDKINLVSPLREENRYRYYSDNDVVDLMYVQVMRFAGFSLSEIKEILVIRKNPLCRAGAEDSINFLENKKEENLKKIQYLKDVVGLLEVSIAVLRNNHFQNEIDGLMKDIYHNIQSGGLSNE